MTFDGFAQFAESATGHRPYPWQKEVAVQGLPELIAVETGAGKTEGVVLPWLWRRRFHPDPVVRSATPHWLVLCLPLRVLTEQVEQLVRNWLGVLGLERTDSEDGVMVHVAMGGREGASGDAWRRYPERDAVVIGTVDMLVSRALNRGYGIGRFTWPIDFGLLHNGTAWVFDEVQLLGAALPTSRQLDGFRDRLGTALPTTSTWMSATVDREAMATVDRPTIANAVSLTEADRSGPLERRLRATRLVGHIDVDPTRRSELGAAVVSAHRPGTLTVIVLNTVAAAREVFVEVSRRAGDTPVHLLHSRFRPDDRRAAVVGALTPAPAEGRIVVSTQVLEAGVDLSASTLITEAAPWPSIVQRAGRCNRDGMADGARLLWVHPVRPDPYPASDVDATTTALKELEGKEVTATILREMVVPTTPAVHQVLRASDLLGLFDTSPDLSGNDIDVAPFIRVTDELDLQVAWRDLGGQPPSLDQGRPSTAELCPIPASREMRDWAAKTTLWRFDHLSGGWDAVRASEIRPGLVLVADTHSGAYTSRTGWDPRSSEVVTPVGVGDLTMFDDQEEPIGADDGTFAPGRWVALQRHLSDVEAAALQILQRMAPPGITSDDFEAVVVAARLHDIGKAHPVFQNTMVRCASDDLKDRARDGAPWAKSGGSSRARHERRYFRHELASALALMGEGSTALEGVTESELAVYLVAAHHGRVRMGIRSVPTEERDGSVLGIREGDVLPTVVIPGGELPASRLSLGPMRLGREPSGDRSWAERALELRDRPDLGPFRLGFMEAVVRLADWRASASEAAEDGDL